MTWILAFFRRRFEERRLHIEAVHASRANLTDNGCSALAKSIGLDARRTPYQFIHTWRRDVDKGGEIGPKRWAAASTAAL